VKPTPQERKITAHAKSVAEKEETTSLEGAKTDFCQLPDSPYRTNTCDPHLSMPKSEPNHPVGGLAWIVRVLDG
jgi:hypothetical protein